MTNRITRTSFFHGCPITREVGQPYIDWSRKYRSEYPWLIVDPAFGGGNIHFRTTGERAIASLGKDHVLFFFFRSDCPYCHAFAPTLTAFEARHGIKVVAISVDGGPMPGFADARADNGIANTLKVTQVPAVFLAQPYTGQITPIGFGVLSESELLERITTVSTPAAQAMLPSVNRQVVLQ